MTLTPDMIAKMTPEQITAYVQAMAQAAPAKGATGGRVEDDDIDNAEGSGGFPGLTEGTFDLTILNCEKYFSADQGDGTSVPMFRVNFTVDKVVEQGPIRERTEDPDKTDQRPPPGPVIAGETRKWQTKTTGDKKNQKNLVRVRELMQALMRFEPGSKLAETAVDANGKAVLWSNIMKEATGEANPFGVKKSKVRVTISRIITQNGKGFAMYLPTWKLHPEVAPRTDNKITSF